MIRSIRARLLIWLLAAVLFTAAAGGVLLYRNALNQANAFFDSQLRLVALTLRDQAFGLSFSPPLSRIEPEYDFVVQVWSWEGVRVYLSHPQAELPGITTLGYSSVESRNETWRVYGVPASDYIIQVAQPLSVRSTRAVQLAWRTLSPLLYAVPLLGLVVWIAVGRNLQPLERLTRAVRQRKTDELTPLQARDVPSEVTPLVDALNDLLARLADVLARERAFIADAAHELRSPLTALRLQAQNLQRSDTNAQELSTLLTGVDRTTRLAEQLLMLARIGPTQNERSRLQLDEVTREVVADLLPIADERRIDIGITNVAPCFIEGEPNAIRMLVRNLVDNAVRYTPEGGRVDVQVSATSSGVEVRVADTGPGVPVDSRERIFDRFYRVPGTTATGSGLGLAIVKAVADAHHATISMPAPGEDEGFVIAVLFPANTA